MDRRSTWAFCSLGKAKACRELREKTSGAFTLAYNSRKQPFHIYCFKLISLCCILWWASWAFMAYYHISAKQG